VYEMPLWLVTMMTDRLAEERDAEERAARRR
jgi:hypothetical protein